MSAEVVQAPATDAVSPALLAAMQRASALSNWFTEHQPQFELPIGKHAYAAALFSIALDHRAAILLLLRHGARSSAFALARPIYEGYMRGVWMLHCVRPTDLENMGKNIIPKFERVVSDLDKSHTTGAYGASKRLLWSTLSDYSHGGVRQIGRWLRGSEMTPTHSDLDCVDLLTMIDLYGFQCSSEIASLGQADQTVYALGFMTLRQEIEKVRADR